MTDIMLLAADLDYARIVDQLLGGMGVLLEIFFLTLLFSMPLGIVIVLGRMSGNVVIRSIFKFYISVMRGTPLMLQLIAVYFGPYYLFHINLASFPFDYRMVAAIIAFTLNYAAYFAEIYRGGIEAVPPGQREAGQILGYSRPQIFFRIVLPQVVRNVLPSVTNEIITLVKDTSLAFTISIMEMFTVAKALMSSESSLVPLVVAGVFYYVMNLIIAFVMGRVEKAMSYYDRKETKEDDRTKTKSKLFHIGKRSA